MSFTGHYNKDIIGKFAVVYLSNRRNYQGIIQDVGSDFIKINGVEFNTEHIVSISIKDKEDGK